MRQKYFEFSSLKWRQGIVLATLLLCFSSGCNFNHPKAQKDTTLEGSGSDAQVSSYSRLQSQLFNTSCANCHNPGRSAGGVDLTSYASTAKGRTQAGEALVVPGKSESSLLYTIIRDGVMPPAGPVSTDLLKLLACWIDQGAAESGDSCQDTALGGTTVATETPATGSGTASTPSTDPVVQPETGSTTPTTQPEAPTASTGNQPDTSTSSPQTETPTTQPQTPSTNGTTETPSTPIATLEPSYPLVVAQLITPTCLRCHKESRPSGGIDLSSYTKIIEGKLDDGSPLVVAGKPDESPLYTVIQQVIMPPSGIAVDQKVQDLLRCWIAAGASETTGDSCSTVTQ